MRKTFALLLTLIAFATLAAPARPTPVEKTPKPAATAKKHATRKRDCGACLGEDHRCNNGVCETGHKFYTHYEQVRTYYNCYYVYIWPDGTNSKEYWEHSAAPCF